MCGNVQNGICKNYNRGGSRTLGDSMAEVYVTSASPVDFVSIGVQ